MAASMLQPTLDRSRARGILLLGALIATKLWRTAGTFRKDALLHLLAREEV
jgi:hypothetical protein